MARRRGHLLVHRAGAAGNNLQSTEDWTPKRAQHSDGVDVGGQPGIHRRQVH